MAGRATCRPSRCPRWTPTRAGRSTRSGRPSSPRPAGRSCPGREEYHGREASLVEWVIFEEEYYRAGAPGRVSQNGIFLLAPIIFDHGTQEQQDRFLPVDGHRREDLGAGLVRARGRLRPGVAEVDRPPRRRARRLGAQRPEDLVLTGDLRALGLRALPLRPGGRAPPRPDLLPVPAGRRRAHRPTDRPARRRGRLRGDLLRGRLRAGRRRARRRRRRLVGRDEHGRQRTRPVAALPRPVLRRRRPAGRPVPVVEQPGRASSRPRDDVVDAWIKAQAYRLYTWGTVTRLADGGDMGAAGSVNKVFWSELDIALHETALDLLGADGRTRVAPGWTATPSRCPARSTPAPTRSSATSSPSGSSVCPASRRGRSR